MDNALLLKYEKPFVPDSIFLPIIFDKRLDIYKTKTHTLKG